jgi:hypothetical protein
MEKLVIAGVSDRGRERPLRLRFDPDARRKPPVRAQRKAVQAKPEMDVSPPTKHLPVVLPKEIALKRATVPLVLQGLRSLCAIPNV